MKYLKVQARVKKKLNYGYLGGRTPEKITDKKLFVAVAVITHKFLACVTV